MKTRYLLPRLFLAMLVCTAGLAFLPAQAQVVDNKGTDFYTSFQPNLVNPFGIELHLTADVATNVTVQYPVNAPTFDVTVAVTPGSITVVTLPNTASQSWAFGTVQNNAVRAFSADEFVAYTVNRASASSDAALALPVDALNTDYLVQTYEPRFFGAQFIVVAAFDNTDVTITPTAPLRSGQPAGTPFTVTLDRGEGFYALSQGNLGAANDLTGTLIEATKPVAVTNGNGCTQVPPGTTACDHIYEVAQPLASWGNSALVSPLPNRPVGSVYRILAAEDNTTLEQNGAVVATLNSGEFHDTGVISGAHQLSADKPIFVTQYMTGISFLGATSGDPAMGNMVPSEQYLSAYTFSTVGGNQFASHFLNVIAENDDVSNGTILLDGASIPAGDFTPIGTSGFSYAVLPLTDGTHSTQSAGVHGITVEGYNSADSYIYPGGARFQFINPGQDETPPVCEGSVDGNTFNGTATDLLADDPENRGIFFVALGPGSTNLDLAVDPFTPGDEQVSYSVSLTDPNTSGSGTVIVTDGAGNTCEQPISLDGANAVCDPADAPMWSSSDFNIDQTSHVAYIEIDTENGFAGISIHGSSDNIALRDVTMPNGDPITGLSYANDLTAFDGTTASSSIMYTGTDMITRVRVSFVPEEERNSRFMFLVSDLCQFELQVDPQVALFKPNGYELAQNHPNPFNPSTSIRFVLPEAAEVDLSVFDVMGRKVGTLASGTFAAGEHTTSWNGQGQSGEHLASGVYFYRLEAGGYIQTRRMVLVR